MFLTLLIVTFIVATLVATIVALTFRKPADQILKRIIADAGCVPLLALARFRLENSRRVG